MYRLERGEFKTMYENNPQELKAIKHMASCWILSILDLTDCQIIVTWENLDAWGRTRTVADAVDIANSSFI